MHKFFCIIFIRFHILVISYDICLCLTSLTMIISRSIHVAANGVILVFFMAKEYSICIYVHLLCPFLCWWIFRLLLCLGYCKQCSMNIGMHVSFQIMVFSGYITRSKIDGSYGSSIFSFYLFIYFGHTDGMRKFPGQGSNPCHSCNLSHSYGNARSLTHCAIREIPIFSF